jgi:hypothetical protein
MIINGKNITGAEKDIILNALIQYEKNYYSIYDDKWQSTINYLIDYFKREE